MTTSRVSSTTSLSGLDERYRFVDNSESIDYESLDVLDFDVIRQLGKGDVGIVNLVHLRGYPPNQQLYALKVLNNKDMIDRNKVHRCDTEKRILQITRHPFIVTMYTTYLDETNNYLLLEYCPGGEFFRVLKTQPQRCLSEAAAKFYASEVLHVLEYLHEIGVVYRDLKPENILIHQSGHIRLTDFDLAKQLNEKNLDSRVKSHNKIIKFFKRDETEEKIYKEMNSFVGTAEYLAPEIIAGEGYSPNVDWWALGILIYEMLFVNTPFEGGDRDKIFDKIVTFDKRELKVPESNAHGPISKSCRDLISRLLRPDAHDRLGHKHGAADIKAHAFFKDVNFDNLHLQTPPIQPQIKDIFDFRNFQNFPINQNIDPKKALEDSSKKKSDADNEDDLLFDMDS